MIIIYWFIILISMIIIHNNFQIYGQITVLHLIILNDA